MLVAIGDNCIDRYLPPIALECVGGNAVNVAANAALHGIPSAYAGVIGDDAQGARIKNALAAIGVNIACVACAAGPTGLTEIQVQGGDYSILLENYGVSDQIDVTPALKRFLSMHASRIHLTVTGRAAVVIRDLHSLPFPKSVDLGIVRHERDLAPFGHLLPFITEAFFSAGSSVSDGIVEAALEKAVLLGAQSAIATRGERGATALCAGKKVSVAPQIAPDDIVDPLGAGDAFISGYLSTLPDYSTTGAYRVEHSLLTASSWAAQACRQIGGWRGAAQ